MRVDRIRLIGFLALVALFASPSFVAAQADVSGTWLMEVTSDQGVTNPQVTIVQDGENLSGTYSSATLGEADITGVVVDDGLTFSFEADLQGQTIPVVYEATLGDDGVMTGTLDIAGGMLTGTFTATRQ